MKMRLLLFIYILVVASLSPSLAIAQSSVADGGNRPTFVLVHGTFQWGGQWGPLAKTLKTEGYSVRTPSMSGLGEREHLLSKQVGLATHISDIVNYIKWWDLKTIILVGHSYGGAVITGVADKIPDRIAHIVYLDATVMVHGESVLLDHFQPEMAEKIQESADKGGDGWLLIPEFLRDPAPATMRKHPLKSYTDRIDLTKGPLKNGTVIVATQTPQIFVTLRALGEKRAKKYGWAFHRVEGPHPLQEKNPSKDKVADILLTVAKSLRSRYSH